MLSSFTSIVSLATPEGCTVAAVLISEGAERQAAVQAGCAHTEWLSLRPGLGGKRGGLMARDEGRCLIHISLQARNEAERELPDGHDGHDLWHLEHDRLQADRADVAVLLLASEHLHRTAQCMAAHSKVQCMGRGRAARTCATSCAMISATCSSCTLRTSSERLRSGRPGGGQRVRRRQRCSSGSDFALGWQGAVARTN
jgi:hypothetical protein